MPSSPLAISVDETLEKRCEANDRCQRSQHEPVYQLHGRFVKASGIRCVPDDHVRVLTGEPVGVASRTISSYRHDCRGVRLAKGFFRYAYTRISWKAWVRETLAPIGYELDI